MLNRRKVNYLSWRELNNTERRARQEAINAMLKAGLSRREVALTFTITRERVDQIRKQVIGEK